MARLINNCPSCKKQLSLTYSIILHNDKGESTERLNFFKCGHFFSEPITEVSLAELSFDAIDNSGKTARDYQKIGVKFIIDSGYNCIIGDQMRLGKTPQSLIALHNSHLAIASKNPKIKQIKKTLILVRQANLYQWFREYQTWVSQKPDGIWPITSTKAFIPPGFDTYIISMDTFSRNGMVDKLLKFGFQLVIVDEAHSFKNTDSNRSQALVKFLHDISEESLLRKFHIHCTLCDHEWTEETTIKINYQTDSKYATHRHSTKCPACNAYVSQSTEKYNKGEDRLTRKCGVVLLTGTAIKNRAEEYFVPLNLVAPSEISSLTQFRRQWLIQNAKGQWANVNPYMLDSFKKMISPYVLRREKEDVYTDLPQINRIYTVIQPDNDMLREAYNKILDKMDETLARKANPSYWDLSDNLMELRRICGLMKVPWTSDYLESAIEDSENQRYAVGIHHHSVRDILKYKLDGQCLSLSGEDSNKDYIMRHFENSKERILIINMLAGGVGMDFHYCDNVIILERMWSSADEQQFEFRFYNPDKSIKNRPTNVEYVLINGTIEAFFYELVERKRKIFGETIGTNWDLTLDSDTKDWRDLVEQATSSRL
jgi:SNF2 family DNA or RNA helicase